MQMPPRSAMLSSRAATLAPVAEDVSPLRDDVAEIDANAEFNAPVRRCFRIALEHAALDLDGTGDGVHDAAEFSEDAISSVGGGARSNSKS